MTSGMPCLLTVSTLRSELVLTKLMDIMQEVKIAEKYLIVFMDTFNATMLHEQIINFNVIINHKETGKPGMINLNECAVKSLSDSLALLSRWKLGLNLPLSYTG